MILSLTYILNACAYVALGFILGLSFRPMIWRKWHSHREQHFPATYEDFIRDVDKKRGSEK
jgi:hypothetical protein